MTLTRILSLAAETMSALNGYRLAQGHKADLSPAPTPNTAPDSAPAHTPSRVMAATVRAPSAQVALAPWHACVFPWHACVFPWHACLFPWHACLFPWHAGLFPWHAGPHFLPSPACTGRVGRPLVALAVPSFCLPQFLRAQMHSSCSASCSALTSLIVALVFAFFLRVAEAAAARAVALRSRPSG